MLSGPGDLVGRSLLVADSTAWIVTVMVSRTEVIFLASSGCMPTLASETNILTK